ncbi:hypothetical protein [Flexibacterium corallicola]|uniref:hypothetical protein n=1 Tax=Flexibacterium corallicola TaxID=3037259 RepID=UPI00286F3A6A|nr:hypothetical protein [Pseudovibrio sp. M1P-2-3]
MISERFEDFAQSLRVFIEQKYKYQDLFLVDANEAIGNVELACKGILDTFASLYDATRSIPRIKFDFYSSPLCSCVLAYRNAKHHNKAHGIRSVHRHAQQNERRDYLLVNYPAGKGEEGGGFIEHYVSWGDFRELFEMPRQENRLRADAGDLIRGKLSAEEFELFAERGRVSINRIFINMIPVIIGAGSEFVPHLQSYIQPQSTEAEHFLLHFQHVEQANFQKPEYIELSSAIFG